MNLTKNETSTNSTENKAHFYNIGPISVLRESLDLNHTDCTELILRTSLETLRNSKSYETQSEIINGIIRDISIFTKSDSQKQKIHSSSSSVSCSPCCLLTEMKHDHDLILESTISNEADSLLRVKLGVEAIQRGEFVVVQDDFDRENEGDLIIASEKVTAEKIAFMVNEATGVICVSILPDRCFELELPQMVPNNTEKHRTAFTVSVDCVHGTTTGISASDRAKTIRALADPSSKPSDFSRPGHIFPLRANPGGVLERSGHTEASLELARLAGCFPSGTICEIVNKDGSMMRSENLKKFAAKYSIQLLAIVDLQRFRRLNNEKDNE